MIFKNLFLGIDGCKSGWICVAIHDLNKWEINVFTSINEIWTKYSNTELILIDMPIGLRDSGPLPRLNDAEARKLLTRKRSSSVFPTPCRAVLSVSTYIEANEKNRQMTGKGLSKQTWNITPKIKEVDEFLRKTPKAREVMIETGPEICFMALNKGRPLEYYKKKEEGITERIRLLKSYSSISNKVLKESQEKLDSKNVAKDDVFDALVLAFSAALGKEKIKFIPQDYEYDSMGLPMRVGVPLFY